MLLEVEGINVRYGRVKAVQNMNVSVHRAEIVTVLGANGAGKTSLLRAIEGLTPVSGGRIRFEGEDISSLSTSQRVRKGLVLVPEGRQILVSMTVEENLLLGAFTRQDGDVARDLAAVYARFSNLSERRRSPASVLSGGEQQMLAIGRALLGRPKLMMLDEPSLGLSPLHVERLFDLLVELNQEGLAILLVEQNTRMALELADRAYVLELGALRMNGPAHILAEDPALTEAYLGGAVGA